MARPVSPCPKCRKVKPLTKHHLFPRRFFGRKNNSHTFDLCRDCHDDLEELIPQHQRLPRDDYPLILLKFLQDTKPRY